MKKLSCSEATQMDLVELLTTLGHHPQRVRNDDYWYISPLRDERTASFKVNRRLNAWYDHGSGKGGDLIDFGTAYFNCTVSELLELLPQKLTGSPLSFQQPPITRNVIADEKKSTADGKITILFSRPIANASLIAYLQKRSIPLEIASRFCREVDFLLYRKQYKVIGFPNNSGGYELRSSCFKGSSTPKDVMFFDNNNAERIAVFEGFFSFLSYHVFNQNKEAKAANYLVLNSLSFFERSRPLMEVHRQVYLFLDRDNGGRQHTQTALQWNRERYIDLSNIYKGKKDLNDWLVQNTHRQNAIKRGIERF